MKKKTNTTPVFIGAGENRISLTPVEGTWTHEDQEVAMYFKAPNGTREIVLDALQKVTTVDEKGNITTTNTNVIVWEMPNDLKVLRKSKDGKWYFTVEVTDEMLESWTDMIVENVRPKGAVSKKNQPVIDNARAKLQAKLGKVGNSVSITDDEFTL